MDNLEKQGPQRRIAQSLGVTFIVLVTLVVGCLSFYHLLAVPKFDSTVDKSFAYSEALSFAGVLVTILAFVSAFYILLLAIDAFKISSDVAKNAYSIRENGMLAKGLQTDISQLQKRIEIEEDRLAQLRSDASLSSDIFRELNGAADETADLLRLLDRTSRALELSASDRSNKDPTVLHRLSKHAVAIRLKVPSLSERNASRQARITILSQLVSEPTEADQSIIGRAEFLLRAEASSGDLVAISLLEKYELLKSRNTN